MSDDKNDIDRLFSLYETNYDNFRKLFAILVGFGLFFLLTVVLPYFLNIYEYYQNEILTIDENNSIRRENINIENLKKKIDDTKREIISTSNRINETKSSMDLHIKQVNNSLSNADKLLGDVNDPSILERLKEKLNQTRYKQSTTIQLAAVVLQSLNNSASNYEQKNESLNRNVSSSKANIAASNWTLKEAKANRIMLNERLGNLTERWKEIQSPFGNLPIDFTNLLAILPIALSGGFHICSVWLAESTRLRMTIDYMRNTHDTKEVASKKGKLYLIAPIWIDPANPNQNKIMQFLLLAIPLSIFVVSALMISYAWEHAPTDPFPTASEVNKNIYYAVYFVCLGVFAYSFWRIAREVKRYDKFIT